MTIKKAVANATFNAQVALLILRLAYRAKAIESFPLNVIALREK
jgi:hypothetical protein